MSEASERPAVGCSDWLGQNQSQHLQGEADRRDNRANAVHLLPPLPNLHRVARRSRGIPSHQGVVDWHVDRHRHSEHDKQADRGQSNYGELRTSDAGTKKEQPRQGAEQRSDLQNGHHANKMNMLNLLQLHKGRSWQSRPGKTKAHAVSKEDASQKTSRNQGNESHDRKKAHSSSF